MPLIPLAATKITVGTFISRQIPVLSTVYLEIVIRSFVMKFLQDSIIVCRPVAMAPRGRQEDKPITLQNGVNDPPAILLTRLGVYIKDATHDFMHNYT